VALRPIRQREAADLAAGAVLRRRGANGGVVRRLAILALAVAIAGSACTRIDTSAGRSGGRHSWTKPGVLRIAGLSDPDTLSPLVGNFQIDVDLSMFWGGYLFNYSNANALVPELAVDVPTPANGGISRDGRTITYHLRKGVTWQDGAPFDAGDVVFTWHAVMNPNNNVGSRQGYDDIERIDTPNAFTAIVHLKRPFSPFVNTFLTMAASPYPVYPRHLLAQYHDLNQTSYNSAPIGTGPFKVVEWHRGQTLRMIANPHYWRGAPKLGEVDYTVIPDENTVLTSMQSHAIDLWFNAPATLYGQASKISDTHAVLTPFTQYSRIGFNTRRPIVSDPSVRRALAMATDRAHLVDVVSYGVNILGEGDQPKFSWAYDAALKPLPYDPAQAGAVLDAAGWRRGTDGIREKNGERLRIEIATVTGSAVGNRLAVLLQAAWHSLGVDAQIKPYVSSLMLASFGAGGILQTGRFDVEFSSWINGIDPDDSSNVMCDQIPPRGQNTFHFCDPKVDAQERIALTSYDQPTRKRAYAQIQQSIVDQLPFLTMWFARRVDVVSNDLHGYKPAHAVTTFWNTWEYSI
jgi:peptide/nickel transport system substrate-binding protein